MHPYILLVKSAVENYVEEEEVILPPNDLPKDCLEKRKAVFVTIKKQGRLRGCIGTYLPSRINLAQEIIYNAIAAATRDKRFDPIQEKELAQLSYAVYVLNEPESVKSIKDLDPKKFGLIVKLTPFAYPNKKVVFDHQSSFKSGLLLPGLPEINSPEKQFLVACQKAGIDPDKEKTYIYKFTVEKFE